MPYCARCNRLTKDEVCNSCGKSGKVREPNPEDPALLVEARFLYASMIEPLLRDGNLHYTKIDQRGWGSAFGASTMLESFRFYVPYAQYEEAYELLAGLFDNDPEMMQNLQEAAGV